MPVLKSSKSYSYLRLTNTAYCIEMISKNLFCLDGKAFLYPATKYPATKRVGPRNLHFV